MAPNDSAQTTDEAGAFVSHRRSKTVRYVVPVAVAGVAAATIGLVPALAANGSPDLPKTTAQELIEKIAASDTQQLSGSVKITTDLGLPSLAGLGGAAGGALAPRGGGDDAKGSSADPSTKALELSSGTHTLRVAADGPDKQRVSILENAAEYSLIHNGDQVWGYDSATNQAFHATRQAPKGDAPKGKAPQLPKGTELPTTPKEFAEQALKASAGTTSVSVGDTAQIAGRDAYTLVIKPKQAGSTVDSVKVAVDAKTGTPLKFTLAPSGGGKAVLDVGFTKVDFGKPAASTFDFKAPKGAKVTESGPRKDQPKPAVPGVPSGGGVKVIGKGWTSIAELKLPAGEGAPAAGSKDLPKEAQGFLDSLGDKVSGKFGSGTVFHTRVVNALMTEDGRVYVGAVTKDALVKAADSAK
ncbi:LolA family protein [Streptomyces sp. NBC_00370]|uniref:LolA family protein n=1 Tax=Streptomyces sp. NBC_00370 TaxID=2975728 RepID=UPI002E26FE3C